MQYVSDYSNIAINTFLFNEQVQQAEDLHYAALRAHKASRSRQRRDDAQSECVYSRVKQ